jgi:MIP family channel proteins
LNRKQLMAEFLGTMGIVFPPIAYGVIGAEHGLIGGALVSGFAVMMMVVTFGPISAAHLNPAVTIGFASAGRFPWSRVPAYVSGQLAGSLAAALLAALVFRPGVGAPTPMFVGDWIRNILLESVITFFLMLVIMAVATVKGGNVGTAAFGIGMAVVSGVLAGGPMTGAAMNPARAFGPALLAMGPAFTALPVFIIGPILGAVVAARVYEAVRLDPDSAQNAPALLAPENS